MVNKTSSYRWSSLLMYLKGGGEFHLSPISKYLKIDNWEEYLNEKVNDDGLNTIRNSTRSNRPVGNSKFISKLEKLTGRSFSFTKQGRPKT
ncbi:MAG: putative transposase [Glaciecola sp.]|jgi:putative transposase